jgi:hypothetical protein
MSLDVTKFSFPVEHLMLRDDRIAFSHKVAELIIWAKNQGWDLVFDEGKVFQDRTGILEDAPQGLIAADLNKHKFLDRVHLPKSFHYIGLAADLLLYINGVYQPEKCTQWDIISNYWISLDPKCTCGKQFKNNAGDYNHFSWGEK